MAGAGVVIAWAAWAAIAGLVNTALESVLALPVEIVEERGTPGVEPPEPATLTGVAKLAPDGSASAAVLPNAAGTFTTRPSGAPWETGAALETDETGPDEPGLGEPGLGEPTEADEEELEPV